MASLTLVLIPGDEWHPLDHTPAPDYIPPSWDGPHVGKRLIETLRTLRRMPMVNGPRVFGNGWPRWQYEWDDLLAQADMERDQREILERAQNRTRIRPSSVEIAYMEAAIAWPARYLRDAPQLLRTVQIVAVIRMRHGDIERAARRLRLPGRLARRWNREGLDLIAAGLRRDRVRVF
jgi:hypothetical protein